MKVLLLAGDDKAIDSIIIGDGEVYAIPFNVDESKDMDFYGDMVKQALVIMDRKGNFNSLKGKK